MGVRGIWKAFCKSKIEYECGTLIKKAKSEMNQYLKKIEKIYGHGSCKMKLATKKVYAAYLPL